MADQKKFKPAWWLLNPHLQTLWPYLTKRKLAHLKFVRERIELLDGDFVDIDWINQTCKGPIVFVLHGLEGSLQSHYAKRMMSAIQQKGWQGAFIHFRGCSGEHNRLARAYHSGDTVDLDYIVNLIHKREPHTRLAAIGYSLGGNVLLKWLGEMGKAVSGKASKQSPLEAAVAISPPLELAKIASRLQQGFSRLYQWHLLKSLRERLLDKAKKTQALLDSAKLKKIKTLYEFDELFTAPMHGFSGADEYYELSSSKQYLKYIKVPTLILLAKDDPFMSPGVAPIAQELSTKVETIISERGGHVGFISGKFPWTSYSWIEKKVPEFLEKYLM